MFLDCTEEFNAMIHHVRSSGLFAHWLANLRVRTISEGKRFANQTKDEIKAYAGYVEEKGEDENHIVILQFKINCLYYAVTVLIFLTEVILGRMSGNG